MKDAIGTRGEAMQIHNADRPAKIEMLPSFNIGTASQQEAQTPLETRERNSEHPASLRISLYTKKKASNNGAFA